MSNIIQLKKYLLEKENPFLLDDNNNGKTIMLSGSWGAGKTYFWQNEIEKKISKQLKDKEKACVYVSLYGKESISEVKSTIYREAYKNIIGEDVISKSATLIGDVATILGKSKNVEAFNKLNNESKDNKSKEILKDGSVICLDDFERKSKKIDLNDLFGFISFLALEMNCKIVIILNSDVFIGKEAEVFRTVKEKTVNKFFYYKPTIEELFESISSDEKYNILNEYKKDILKAIKDTEELNARIYIQVLDNCLEWLEVKENLDENTVRVLVLGTFNFVLNHMVLDYQKISFTKNHMSGKNGVLKYGLMNSYSENIDFFEVRYIETEEEYFKSLKINQTEEQFITNLSIVITSLDNEKRLKFSDAEQALYLNWIKENESKLKSLWKYGYRLYYVADVEEETYNEIAKFIKSGILI